MKWNKKMVLRAYTTVVTFLISSFFLAACGSVNKVAIQEDISNAEVVITNAQTADVDKHAPLELRMAKERLQQARSAFNQEQYTTAQYYAEEALITAELAQEKSRTEKTKAIVEELRRSIEILERELMRVQGS